MMHLSRVVSALMISAATLFSFAACSPSASGSGSMAPAHETVRDSVAQTEDTITFALVGDVMTGTTFPETPRGAYLPSDDGRHLFDHASPLFKSADIACANLEGVLLDGAGKPRPMTNPSTYYLFRMPERHASLLVSAGIDFVGVANNHINDFGAPGRSSTLATLRSVSLTHAGLKDSCDFGVIDVRGRKVAITQFGHGDNNLDVNDLDLLRVVIGRMRDSADMVVVSFHGGAEGASHMHVPAGPEMYVGEKRGNVREFAHAAIDAGADMVYGHGPHVPRAWELYKGHLIIYSLGNFCAPYRLSLNGPAGLAPLAVVSLTADGRFVGGRIHSLRQHRGIGPRIDSSGAAASKIAELTLQDFPATPLVFEKDGTVRPR